MSTLDFVLAMYDTKLGDQHQLQGDGKREGIVWRWICHLVCKGAIGDWPSVWQ